MGRVELNKNNISTKDSKYFTTFQQLAKILITPVMILPIVGILMGIGSAFTSPTLLKVSTFLQNNAIQTFFNILKAAGSTVFNNISVIFAISIAIGYAKKEKGIAGLCAFIAFAVMHGTISTILISLGKLNPAKLGIGQTMVLGIPSVDMGVFGGIIIGFLVAYLHNKYYNVLLPPIFSIFSGTKFVPVVSVLGAIVTGLGMSFVWPVFQSGLGTLSTVIKSTGVTGSFIYGFTERALLPFGLHHFVYLPFFFTSLGGSTEVGGKLVQGAINIFQAQLASPKAMFDINVTRFLMNGKVIFAMFGLPGAALAMYHTAKPENKNKVKTLLIAAIIPAFFTGTTEPIEFTFLFVAPVLYGIHAVLVGFAYSLTYLFKVNIPGSTAFGGPFLSFVFNGIMQQGKGSNWIYGLIIGIVYFFAYYFIFRFMIERYNLQTPGREISIIDTLNDNIQSVQKKSVSNDIINEIITALGGAENIINVDACFTRLRVKVKDVSRVSDEKIWRELGASGFLKVENGVQVIFGTKADVYKSKIKDILGLE